MDAPLEIVYRDVEPAAYIDQLIRDKTGKLHQHFQHIIWGQVIVDLPHRSHRTGNAYHVTVEINVPGRKLVVSNDPGDSARHEDVRAAINDAFAAMVRQLEDHSRVHRFEVKAHHAPLQGKVIRKFPEQGYGFVATNDGREVYFHENSVVQPGFQDLKVDETVRVVLAAGDSPVGPHATTIERIGAMRYDPAAGGAVRP